MHTYSSLRKDQKGIVSIIVTLLIMIVLTLIVVGFARLSRREQRQVLDRQLSAQAYYAAETGVSDALQAIKKEYTTGTNLNFARSYTERCDGPDSFIEDAGPLVNKISTPSGDVYYTCLLVDPDPPSLEYSNVDTNFSRVVPVFSKDGTPISSITVEWQDKAGGTTFNGCADHAAGAASEFPATWPSDCNTGIMRVDLVPVPGNVNPDNMLNTMATVFLHPWPDGTGGAGTSASYTGGGGAARPGFGNTGNIVRVNCASGAVPEASKRCSLEITGLEGLNSNAFMLRLRSIYRPSVATVKAARVGGGLHELRSAQAMIDSTGKSGDVLRRVQVRVPIAATDLPFPEFAIQSAESICKRFGIAPGTPSFLQNEGPSPECDFSFAP